MNTEAGINRGMERILRSFSGLRVLLIGDSVLDGFMEGSTRGLCREAPVPVVQLQEARYAPGGAANTAVNLAALGAQVTFLSAWGGDPDGALLGETLEARGVAVDHVRVCRGRRTVAKRRVLAGGHLLVRLDQGDSAAVDADTEKAVARVLAQAYRRSDAVIVSDYAQGLLTPGLISELHHRQDESPRVLVVDSRRLPLYRAIGATAVKPNYDEVCAAASLPCEVQGKRAAQVSESGERILDRTGSRMAAVSLDVEGAVLLERGRPAYRTYGRHVTPARAAGAGDAFVAAFTLALAAGVPPTTAAEVGSAAAAVAIGQRGTASCRISEIVERFAPDEKRLVGEERIVARAELYRRAGQRIVFTNGCFDLLHRGHVTYLSRAKALGDVLFVGVNSDASVARLKGSGRPINPLEDRMEVLSALSCVDHIIPFDGDTASGLIRWIRPDVFAKGADYAGRHLPEAPLVEAMGGMLVLLPYVDDVSTSGTLRRIRSPRKNPADQRVSPGAPGPG
ncbi:MAG: PfkB family carbohydrate kinase [Acidiferrobacteraceae bacterium]